MPRIPQRLVIPTGPRGAQLAVVGSISSADDCFRGMPFAGSAGTELARLFSTVGLQVSNARRLNVVPQRVPGDTNATLFTEGASAAKKMHLHHMIGERVYCSELFLRGREDAHKTLHEMPNLRVVLLIGDAALLAFFGETSSAKWRGSMLRHPEFPGVLFICTQDIPTLFRAYYIRPFILRDLQRVASYLSSPESYPEPDWKFQIRPSYDQAKNLLKSLIRQANRSEELWLSVDIETIARNIACVSIAWSIREAICIPIMGEGGTNYWEESQEVELTLLFRQLLTHPHVHVIGQNYNYDNFFFVWFWFFISNHSFDTMNAQHVIVPGTPKDLATLASLYCHHYTYWKDELEDYKSMPADVEQFWNYNCKDTCYTFEIALAQREILSSIGKWPQFDEQMEIARAMLTVMVRGVRVNVQQRSAVASQLQEAAGKYNDLIQSAAGEELNVKSPKQMVAFLYTTLQQRTIFKRGTSRPTADEKALQQVKEREPLLAPLLDLITTLRSIGVYLSTFCGMRLDSDQRVRCSFNTGGTETFRFSSSQNPLGNGGNLQTIPAGEEGDE